MKIKQPIPLRTRSALHPILLQKSFGADVVARLEKINAVGRAELAEISYCPAVMNTAQSKSLKIGQRVLWKKKETVGTVVRVNSDLVQIRWDSGKMSYHRHTHMQEINLVT